MRILYLYIYTHTHTQHLEPETRQFPVEKQGDEQKMRELGDGNRIGRFGANRNTVPPVPFTSVTRACGRYCVLPLAFLLLGIPLHQLY